METNFEVTDSETAGVLYSQRVGDNSVGTFSPDGQLRCGVYGGKIRIYRRSYLTTGLRPPNAIPVPVVFKTQQRPGTTLVDVPSDNLWYNTIQSMLLSISGIVSVTINPTTNQITIKSNSGNNISTQEVIVELIIVYDIDCLS